MDALRAERDRPRRSFLIDIPTNGEVAPMTHEEILNALELADRDDMPPVFRDCGAE